MLETMYFQGKVSNESFKVLLSASVATNIGKLSLLDAYITPLDVSWQSCELIVFANCNYENYFELLATVRSPLLANCGSNLRC